MAARLVASTSCLRCALTTASPSTLSTRHIGKYTARLDVFTQGKPTRKTALSSRRTARPSIEGGPPNPTYLQNLIGAPGGWTKKHRIGRGIGSGRGKGRRGKGAGQDRGDTRRDFNGGASSILSKMIPKRIIIPKEPGYAPFQLHVDRLAYYIRQGRIDPSLPITLRELYASGCTPAKKGGVRLYGTPSLSALDPTRTFPSLSIIVTKASPKAIRSVEAAGGTIVTRYHSPMAVRAITQPEAYEHQGKAVPRSSDPTSKRDLDYYASPENRGYIWLREANNVERSRARRSAKETATSSSTVTEGALPGQGGLENPPDRRAEEA